MRGQNGNGVPVILSSGGDGRYMKLQWIAAIFFFTYVIHLIFVLNLKSTPFYTSYAGEGLYYDYWARVVAGGDLLAGDKVYSAPPLIIYYLAVIYRLFPDHALGVRLAGIFFASLSSVLVFLLGLRVFSGNIMAALTSAIFTSLYTGYMYYEAVMPGSLFTVFISLVSLSLLWKAVSVTGKKAIIGTWVTAGICFGLAVTGRPNLLGFLPWLGFAAFKTKIVQSGSRKILLWPILSLALFFLGTAMIMTPVFVRNYLVEKDMVFVPHFGIALYTGNNPDLPLGYGKPPHLQGTVEEFDVISYRNIANIATGRVLKPSEVSAYFARRALKYIISQPAAFIKRCLFKLGKFFSRYDIPGDWGYDFVARYITLLKILLRDHFLIPVGVAATVTLILYEKKPAHFLPSVMILYYAMLIVPFIFITRYRLIVMPFFMLNTGWLVSFLYNKLRNKSYTPVIWSVVVILIFFGLFARVDGAPGDQGAIEAYSWLNLGVIFEQQGRPQDALECFLKSRQADPALLTPYIYAGDLYYSLGNPEMAVETYKEGLKIDPSNAELHYSLFLLYKLEGDDSKAKPELALAYKYNPLLNPETVSLWKILKTVP